MSNITLCCLIQGTGLDKVFKIKIDKENDISDLKESIWNKNKNTFANIDANDIILWKVNVPMSEKAKFERLNKSTVEDILDGMKLNDAMEEVEEVFGNSPEKKYIHVIVGQPTTSAFTTSAFDQEELTRQTKAMHFQNSNEYNGKSAFSGEKKFSHKQDNNYDETNPFETLLPPPYTMPSDQNRPNVRKTGIDLFGKLPCTFKILLLGGTGTGKSTIINMLANYFLGGTLENPKVVIPTKHFGVTENAFMESNSEAKIGDVTKSQTTKCHNYEFEHPENKLYKFIFIDTPGMSDTNGVKQDDKNIQEIINAAIDAGSLSAIIIIASGTEARVTPTIKNTLVRLANNLPDEVYNNLLLILTKCAKSSACFSEDNFANDIARPKHIFYMDNQVFCTDPKIWLHDEEEYFTVKQQWEKSHRTFDNLLKMITELNVTSTQAFTKMCDLRNKIKSEIAKISQNITNIQLVQDKLDAAQMALQRTGDQKNSFSNYTTTQTIKVQKFVKKEDGTKDTVCTTHRRDGFICHKSCGLELTTQSGTNTFVHCYCMGSGGKCSKCGCGSSSHFHDDTEMVTEDKTIQKVLEDIKAQYEMADQQHKKISASADNYKTAIENLQAAADANYNKIHELCIDLSNICSRFNFVDELYANIENMRMDAKSYNNCDIRAKAETEVKKLEKLASDLSSKVSSK